MVSKHMGGVRNLLLYCVFIWNPLFSSFFDRTKTLCHLYIKSHTAAVDGFGWPLFPATSSAPETKVERGWGRVATWKKPNPYNPSETLGEAVMGQRDVRYQRLWVWVGWAVTFGWILLFNVSTIVFLKYLDREHPPLAQSPIRHPPRVSSSKFSRLQMPANLSHVATLSKGQLSFAHICH